MHTQLKTAVYDNQPQLRSLLGDRLRKIRAEIVASGSPLLTWEGVEQEKAERS